MFYDTNPLYWLQIEVDCPTSLEKIVYLSDVILTLKMMKPILISIAYEKCDLHSMNQKITNEFPYFSYVKNRW